MRKILKFLLLGFVGLLALGIFLIYVLNFTFWLDEGDPGFKNTEDIRTTIKNTLPNRDFVNIRYYKIHKNPLFINSLYVSYVDEAFEMDKISKYLNKNTGEGEFVLLANTLCNAKNLRDKYKYKAVTFHVTSSETGARYFYENYFICHSLKN